MARNGINTKLLNNRIVRGGRDAIQIINKNSEVAWNDVSYSNLIADDCGLIYVIGSNPNIDFHHNWFHDARGRGKLFKAAGIYLDSSNDTDLNPVTKSYVNLSFKELRKEASVIVHNLQGKVVKQGIIT